MDKIKEQNLVKHREASLASESTIFGAADNDNARISKCSQDLEKATSSGTTSDDDEELVSLGRESCGRVQIDSYESRFPGTVMMIRKTRTIGPHIVG